MEDSVDDGEGKGEAEEQGHGECGQVDRKEHRNCQ